MKDGSVQMEGSAGSQAEGSVGAAASTAEFMEGF